VRPRRPRIETWLVMRQPFYILGETIKMYLRWIHRNFLLESVLEERA
jgi:hypothetical protein